MPLPTQVTEPRLGIDAFAENDEASQLAQAAFLLLVGQELRRSRERSTPAVTHEIVSQPPDEDAAAFRIPQISSEGRRYPLDEAFPRDRIRRMPVANRKDMLHPMSRDLANNLQNFPTDRVAAALLTVCCYRPEPIVQVAAATASFEITADPVRSIAILAKATRDKDPLVRELAATALARVYPEHSALRRLAPQSRRGTRRTRAHTSLLVHGTWARTDIWWQPGGDFHSYLLASVLPDLYAGADRYDWSGSYSDAARLIAANELQTWINDHSVTNPLIVGHSHGANVILLATQLGVTTREVVLLSCPVHWPVYAPDFSRVGKVVSIRVHLDLVILADGGGQRFHDPRIREHVLPVWFNHSATHDPAVWVANDVPSML